MRVLAVVAALFAAAVVAAAMLLPRLADRPEVRTRIEAAVHEATGREISYESIRAGLLPPSIDVIRPALAGGKAGPVPAVEADRISLRLALLPLLARSVVIESLRIEGARAVVVREPAASPAPSSSAARPSPDASAPSSASAQSPAATPPAPGAGALGVRAIDVDRGGIRIEDRTVSPPVVLALSDVEAHARATSPEEPVRFDATMQIESGGSIAVQGTATTGGEIDAAATLDGVDAKPFAGYLAGGAGRTERRTLAGRLGGTVRVSGPAATPAKIDAKLRFEDAAVELDGVGLRGVLSVSADLSSADGALGGPFEIDAIDADLSYGSVFRKPPGTPATVRGTLRARPGGGFDVDDLHVRIKNFDAHGAARSAPGAQLALAAPPFDLAGWQALLPAIGGRDLTGRLGLDLRGSALDSAPAVTFAATGRDIDARALGEKISGPLRFDARFAAPLASGRPFTDVVSGTVDFVLGPGSFQGVSMLRDTIQRSGPVVEAAVAAGRAFGGRDVQRMYDDRFERIAGSVKVGSGFARFDPVEAVYRDYRVDLRGSVRLSDRALDARGAIVFADAKGAGAMRGQTLPISRIGGSLDRPQVELSPADIAAVVASASGSAIERRLGPVLDRLRESSGGAKSPLGALENLLQGRKRN